MAITKLRQQEIIQYKIDILAEKLSNFISYGISNTKYNKLETKRDNFIIALAIIDAS